MLAGAAASSKVHAGIQPVHPDNVETQVVEAEVTAVAVAEHTEPEIPPSQPRPREDEVKPPEAD